MDPKQMINDGQKIEIEIETTLKSNLTENGQTKVNKYERREESVFWCEIRYWKCDTLH